MAISSSDFKNAMRRLGSSVTVITSVHDGQAAGLTATAVCSLSAEPPRLIACVNKSGLTYETIDKSRVMAINILRRDQQDLAMRFAGMMKEGEDERFDPSLWSHGQTGALMLRDAIISFDCRVEQIMDGGTHAICISSIEDISCAEGEIDPLMYIDGQWASLLKD